MRASVLALRIPSIACIACFGCGEIIGIGDPRLGDPEASGGSAGSGGVGGEAGGGGSAGGGAPPACEGCTGDLLWSRAYGQSGTTEATALAVRGDGHTVIAGQADGNVDLGQGVTMGSGDGLSVIALELDEEGNTVWSQRFTGSGQERVEAAALTPTGDVILVGRFDTDIDFGGPPTVSSGGEDAFVAKLAGSDGTTEWLRTFGGPGDQIARDVDVDAAGRILVFGDYETSIQLSASVTHTSQGATDIFLAELDDNGDHVDSQVFGGSTAEHGRAMAFDADGGIVIGGDYEATLDLGSVTLPNGAMIESYVAKIGSLGETLWARQLGGNNDQYVCGLAAEGVVAVTGGFESEVRFEGADEIGALYAAQQLLAVLDSDGLLVSLNGLGDTSTSGPSGRVLMPAIDDAGHLLLAGWLEGTANIGARMHTSAGQDALYAKLSPDGGAYWSHIAGDGVAQRATGLGAHGEAARITGVFEGTLDMGQGPHSCPAAACLFIAALTR